MTIINMPLDLTEASTDSDGLVWKQIIPLDKEIVYGGQKLRFSKDILEKIKTSYDANVLQQTAFQLVDDQNRHDTEEDVAAGRNFDPRRYHGDVKKVTVDERGFRAGFALTEDGKDLIKKNPKLGVSASIKPNYVDEQGKVHDFVLRHVVGTLDPKIKHMSPWETEGITLSATDDPNEEVFDLTTTEPAPAKDENGVTLTREQYDEMVSQINEFNEGEAFLDEILAEVEDDEVKPVAATNLSVTEPVKDPRITALENKVAASDWKAEKAELIREGVPANMVNLCDSVMSVAHSPMINLSDGQEADPRSIIRNVLKEAKGYIDLSAEAGHGANAEEREADDAYADGFINEYLNPLF